MTKLDDHEIEEPSMLRYWLQLLGWSLMLCVALFTVGILIGYFANFEGKMSFNSMLIIGGAVGSLGLAGYFIWRWFPDFTLGEPNTPRGNRVRWVLVAIIIISILISLPLVVADTAGGESYTLFSNGAVPPTPALVMLLGWGLLLPPLVIFARKNADEHKLGTQDFGMMVGFQVFCVTAPVWWMGYRGGFFPQPDVMIILVVVMIVATLTTVWKQAR